MNFRNIQEKPRGMWLPDMTFNWKWASTPRPNAAFFCCPAAESLKEALSGPLASAAWLETTNGSQRFLLAFTISNSPASCSFNT